MKIDFHYRNSLIKYKSQGGHVKILYICQENMGNTENEIGGGRLGVREGGKLFRTHGKRLLVH